MYASAIKLNPRTVVKKSISTVNHKIGTEKSSNKRIDEIMSEVTESDEDTQSFDGDFSLLSSSNPASDPIQSQTIPCLKSPIEFPILDAQLVRPITTSLEASRFNLGSFDGISNAAIGKGLSNQGMSIDAQCLVGLPVPTVNRIWF
ncbi:hypothetical protein L1887_24340 [Cichorium endivia]|nr:hypothetical protein L1887_24340 [Cichorium endivia]